MASIHLQGILKDSLGEIDVGAIITFTHMTTTGETIASTKRNLLIPPNGAYSIDVEYGQIRIDYTTRYTERFVSMVIVNQDSTATSLPELLNAAVPATPAVILEMQGILADAVAASDTSEAFANQLTTLELIGSVAVYASNIVIDTSGFLTSGSGGGQWKQNGVTGRTPSQSPIQLGSGLLNDGNGNQWSLINNGPVNARSLGAGIGNYDDLPVQAAVNYAISTGVNSVYKPAGSYKYPAPTSDNAACVLFPESSDLDIVVYGDGASTVVTVEDNIDHGFDYCAVFGNASGLTPTLAAPGRGGYGKVFIHSMKIEGAWRVNYNDPINGKFGRNLFGFSKLDHLKTKYIEANNLPTKYTRGGFHNRYTAMFNTINVAASDVFRAQESENVVISFNKVKNADDDAIAVHSERTVTNVNSAGTILIQGNIIEDSEGILILGGKIVNISNNILNRTHGTCLAVLSLSAGTEGQSPSHTVMIANNIITDPLTRADSGVFSVTNETQGAIIVGRSFVTPLAGGDVPTRPRANATFIPQYSSADAVQLMYTNDMYASPSSGGTGVSVMGNTISRTIPSGVNYNSLGHGMYIDRFGAWNPVVQDASILYSGIVANNDVNGLKISENTVTSMHMNGIRLRRVENLDDPWELGFTNGTISGNTVIDCTQGLGSNVSAAAFTVNWTIDISGNTFDCDPWHKDPSRRLVGGWNVDAGISELCSGLMIRNILGITANNNTFKNCYIPIKAHQTELVDGQGYNGSGNVVYCKPIAAGFHTGNGGVGDIGFGSEYTHVVYEAGTTASNYGEIITNPNQTGNAKPTTGTYVQGFRTIRGNINSGGNDDRRTGWLRVSTGSSHVEGVDWKPQYEQGASITTIDANLLDIANSINTDDKYTGKLVFSANRPLWSSSAAASAGWRDSAGAIVITPV